MILVLAMGFVDFGHEFRGDFSSGIMDFGCGGGG